VLSSSRIFSVLLANETVSVVAAMNASRTGVGMDIDHLRQLHLHYKRVGLQGNEKFQCAFIQVSKSDQRHRLCTVALSGSGARGAPNYMKILSRVGL